MRDAREDAVTFGSGFEVDGVAVHPSRVTVYRPTPQRADAEGVGRAEEIAAKVFASYPFPREDDDISPSVMADFGARCILATMPRASQQAGMEREAVVKGIIAALTAEQKRCDALDHILDTSECIAVIREWAALQPAQEGREG